MLPVVVTTRVTTALSAPLSLSLLSGLLVATLLTGVATLLVSTTRGLTTSVATALRLATTLSGSTSLGGRGGGLGGLRVLSLQLLGVNHLVGTGSESDSDTNTGDVANNGGLLPLVAVVDPDLLLRSPVGTLSGELGLAGSLLGGGGLLSSLLLSGSGHALLLLGTLLGREGLATGSLLLISVGSSSTTVLDNGGLGIDGTTLLHGRDERIGGTLGGAHVIELLEGTGDNGQEVLGAPLQEITIVSNSDQTTRELVGGGDKGIDGVKIQEIGRFVHDEEMRGVEGKLGEDDARTLRVGQVLDGSVGDGLTNGGPLKMGLQVTLVGLREGSAHELDGGHVHLQLLGRVLTEVGELVVRVDGDLTLGGGELLGDELQEGGLTSTIGTHDTNTSTELDVVGDGLVEDVGEVLRVVGETDVLDLDEGDILLVNTGGALEGRGGLEGELVLHQLATLGTGTLPLTVSLPPGVGGRVGIDVAVPLHVLLDHLLVVSVILDLALLELLEAAVVVLQLLVLDQHDRGDDVLQKSTIVSNSQERTLVTTKTVLKPQNGRHIQMVSGLVEQQELGLNEESGGEGNTHPQTTRQGRDEGGLTLLIETENTEHTLGTLDGGLRAELVQVLLDVLQVGLEGGLALLVLLLTDELGQVLLTGEQHTAELVGAQDRVDDGEAISLGVVLGLLHVVNVDVLRELGHLTGGNGVEQASLTRSVDTVDGTPLVGLDLEEGVDQQVTVTEGGLEVDGHLDGTTETGLPTIGDLGTDVRGEKELDLFLDGPVDLGEVRSLQPPEGLFVVAVELDVGGHVLGGHDERTCLENCCELTNGFDKKEGSGALATKGTKIGVRYQFSTNKRTERGTSRMTCIVLKTRHLKVS